MLNAIWPRSLSRLHYIKPYLISLSVVVILFVLAAFMFLYNRTNQIMLQRVREQAITYVDLINHAKSWNLDYGGMYVEKKGGVESNTYLKELGINPDIKAESGRTFTVRNHAIMISEISRRSETQDGVQFRITSLWPLDPKNKPDDFEREGLNHLTGGDREYYRFFPELPLPVFRYLKPMYADSTCLECHPGHNYKYGDVIGAISVSIPVTIITEETQTTQLMVLFSSVISICLVLFIVYVLTWRLAIKLDEAQQRLNLLASTDPLTGLNNRRHVMERLEEELQRSHRLNEPLSIISIDIDHFKSINDTYGHPCGDLVLQQLAEILRNNVRSYDVVGRIGGEEFLIINPGTNIEDALALAERILATVRAEPVNDGECSVSITISAGIAVVTNEDLNVGILLRRVDRALYKAKEQGRDCIEIASST